METGHTFINPLENLEITEVKSNSNKRKLWEELEILKERKNNNILICTLRMNLVKKKYFNKNEFNNGLVEPLWIGSYK